MMIPTINKKETGANLRRIMNRCGLSAKDVQEYLGLGCVQSVYRWLDGINMPTIDNLYALSELFQVPIDSIVRGNREGIKPSIILNTMELHNKRLFTYYQKLSELRVA